MSRRKAIALVVLLIPTALIAEKSKKHNDVPAVFETAHSVYVQATDGDYSKPGLNPADRQAIADVQDALRAWSRYTLAVHPEQADLVFVVHKAPAGADSQANSSATSHLPGVQSSSRTPGLGGAMGGSQGGGLGGAQGGDADSIGAAAPMGPEGDRLLVYTVGDGKLKGPVWTREMRGGLDPPSLTLVQQLKLAVERTFPAPPPPPKPAP